MSKRPTCETPGCGRSIPVGGEGHPEVCPKCLAREGIEVEKRATARVTQQLHRARQRVQILERLLQDVLREKYDDDV